jgi:hypothetical protein
MVFNTCDSNMHGERIKNEFSYVSVQFHVTLHKDLGMFDCCREINSP